MTGKLFLIFGVVGSILMGVTSQISHFVTQQVLAQTYEIDPAARQQILEATVQITLFAPLLDETGQPKLAEVNGQQLVQYVVGEGLGTLVSENGRDLIVTHDHWTLLEDMTKATFTNVSGDLLLTATAVEFAQMIQYRDGGTMILALTGNLPGTAVLSRSETIGQDDVLLLAYRQPETMQVDVVPVLVEELKGYQERPSFYLHSLHDEAIVGGNSGGGLFANGKLVGNMWITLVTQEVTRATGTAVGPEKQTSLSIAAQLPLQN